MKLKNACLSIIITPTYVCCSGFIPSGNRIQRIASEHIELSVHADTGLHNPTALSNLIDCFIREHALTSPRIAITLYPVFEQLGQKIEPSDHAFHISHELQGKTTILYNAAIKASIYCQYMMWSARNDWNIMGLYPAKIVIAELAHAHNVPCIDFSLSAEECALQLFHAIRIQNTRYGHAHPILDDIIAYGHNHLIGSAS